jgi:hypothetical protein
LADAAQSFQLLHPIAAQGLVVIDAMDREQSLDPVDVLDAFADQPTNGVVHTLRFTRVNRPVFFMARELYCRLFANPLRQGHAKR